MVYDELADEDTTMEYVHNMHFRMDKSYGQIEGSEKQPLGDADVSSRPQLHFQQKRSMYLDKP